MTQSNDIGRQLRLEGWLLAADALELCKMEISTYPEFETASVDEKAAMLQGLLVKFLRSNAHLVGLMEEVKERMKIMPGDAAHG
jgi:hypothetical protein